MELPRQQLFSNKKLVALILPLFLEQMLGTLVGMVDGIMVSSVGESAISAVSLVGNISAVMLNLFAALATGGSIVTSQLIGAGRKEDSRRSAGQVITMTVAVSAMLGLGCLLFSRPLLHLVFSDVEKQVMDDSVTYFFYDALSYPFLALCSAGAAIMRANGNSKVTFYVSMLRNAVNVAGNAICIYGLKMGVEGVAIPTALCRVVGAVAIMLVVMSKKQPLRPRKPTHNTGLNRQRTCTKTAIPMPCSPRNTSPAPIRTPKIFSRWISSVLAPCRQPGT